MADPSKTPPTGLDVGVQYIPNSATKVQISVAYDPSRDPTRPVETRGTHRRNAIHELSLANHAKTLRPVCPIHRTAFDEHRRDHVVSRANVGKDLVEQVAMRRPLIAKFPQVMMRITDR